MSKGQNNFTKRRLSYGVLPIYILSMVEYENLTIRIYSIRIWVYSIYSNRNFFWSIRAIRIDLFDIFDSNIFDLLDLCEFIRFIWFMRIYLIYSIYSNIYSQKSNDFMQIYAIICGYIRIYPHIFAYANICESCESNMGYANHSNIFDIRITSLCE